MAEIHLSRIKSSAFKILSYAGPSVGRSRKASECRRLDSLKAGSRVRVTLGNVTSPTPRKSKVGYRVRATLGYTVKLLQRHL